MKADEMVKRLEPWLAKHRRPAWKPLVIEGDGEVACSKFSGMPWLASETDWPRCNQCKQPLQLFLQLDLAALPTELGQCFGAGLLQLYYCTSEECEGGWEPFSDDISRVRIVHPQGLGQSIPPRRDFYPAKRIIAWERIIDEPMPCEHDLLGLKYTYDFDAGTLRFECPEVALDLTNPMNDCPAEEIALSAHGDKLGGWPAWIQGVEYPACPRCRRPMIHVFQIDSEDNLPFMFGDVGCGHITQCPDHKDVVAFGWACS